MCIQINIINIHIEVYDTYTNTINLSPFYVISCSPLSSFFYSRTSISSISSTRSPDIQIRMYTSYTYSTYNNLTNKIYNSSLSTLYTLSLASLLPLLISLTSQSRSLDIQINMHISYINTIINTII